MTKVTDILNQLAIFFGLRSAVDYGNGKLAKACLEKAEGLERRQALSNGPVPILAPPRWIVEEVGELNHEDLTGEEVDALRLGDYVRAVKSVRLRTKLDLREAKQVVDEIVSKNTEYHRCPTAQLRQAQRTIVS